MKLRVIRKLFSARRAQSALLTNALSSIGNFALAISIARNAPIDSLGQFGVAFSIYALVTGFARATIAESVLSSKYWLDGWQESCRQVSFIGLIGGLLVAGVGFGVGSPYLLTIGLGLPGLVIYDYLKTIQMAVGRSRRALCQEAIWTTFVLIAVVAAEKFFLPPLFVFIVWSTVGGLLALIHAIITGCDLLPRWRSARAETSRPLSFGADYLAGSGIAQLTMGILSLTAGNAVVGSFRGAATLLGPITIVVSTARALLIPYLVNAQHSEPRAQTVRALKVTLLLVAFVLPCAVFIALLPDRLGVVLLGTNWKFAEPLLPALALELVFAVAETVPFAGHRAARAARKTLAIRLALAPVRLGCVVVASIFFGAQGVAYSLAALALLGLVIWWSSYLKIVRLK